MILYKVGCDESYQETYTPFEFESIEALCEYARTIKPSNVIGGVIVYEDDGKMCFMPYDGWIE